MFNVLDNAFTKAKAIIPSTRWWSIDPIPTATNILYSVNPKGITAIASKAPCIGAVIAITFLKGIPFFIRIAPISPTKVCINALAATTKGVDTKNPKVEPIPTITAEAGPKSIATNKGTCDAKVAVKGPNWILKIQRLMELLWLKQLKLQHRSFFLHFSFFYPPV